MRSIMTGEVQNVPPDVPPMESAKRSTFVWRIAAIALIFAAMLGLAHFLKNPSRLGGNADATAAAKAGEDPFAPVLDKTAPHPDDRREKMQDLRKIMGGVVMAAADEDGPYNDPANQDPEERRRFLAGVFGLPFEYPKSEVLPDLVPASASVLMVFEDPARQGRRIVMMSVPGTIDEALAAIHNQYKAAGYQTPGAPDPVAAATQGRLMRFTKGNRDRVVYARPRNSGKETLVAVYDESR